VDYLAARHLKRCSGSTSADVAKDVLAVAAYLQGQPLIKPSQITAIGWSLGGSAALDALRQIGSGEKRPLDAVIAYTPPCGTLGPWSVKVPALILMGANDQTAPAPACQQLFTKLAPGTPFAAHVYPDAGHVFNIAGAPGYDAAATAAASRDMNQFMNKSFR
jgi:dienelactone hydrolase